MHDSERIETPDLIEIGNILREISGKIEQLMACGRNHVDGRFVVGIQRDIEKDIKRITEITRRNKLLSMLASHELNSAMSAIQLAAMDLSGHFQGESDANAVRIGEMGMWRARAFLGSAEYWAKNPEMKLSKENILKVLLETAEAFNLLQKERGVRLNLHLPETELFSNIHKNTLELLVFNIFSNAMKRGRANEISVEVFNSDGRILIVIKDNGCGVDDEIAPHIFDFGFSGFSSSGIGLAEANGRMENMGGAIVCDKHGGIKGGAKFTLMLKDAGSVGTEVAGAEG